eukprot:Skav222919  [mRNA]  locus=scaffold1489:285023:293276:+ [translate_table: standard]
MTAPHPVRNLCVLAQLRSLLDGMKVQKCFFMLMSSSYGRAGVLDSSGSEASEESEKGSDAPKPVLDSFSIYVLSAVQRPPALLRSVQKFLQDTSRDMGS